MWRGRWRPFRRLRSDIGFGAFISYSGEHDRELIGKMQNGIERLAKKWFRPPVTRVFVDKTSIAAGTRLWSRIQYGLERSSWLILLASPEAAQSWWVDRELEWWIANRSLDNVIVVHTAGSLDWDRDLRDFSSNSTALPPRLRGIFPEEPVWVSVPRADRGPNVERAVLNITAAVRRIPIHELSSQAYREHRRTMRWARGAIATLSLLLVAALVLSFFALTQKRHADTQARIALSRQLAAVSNTSVATNPRAAMILAAKAFRIDENAQTLAALMRADMSSPKLVRYFRVGGPVTLLDGSRDGTVIIAGLGDGRVVRWNVTEPQPETVLDLPGAVEAIGASSDASVIVASDGSVAKLWRTKLKPIDLPLPAGQNATAVTISPSGRTAIVHAYSGFPDGVDADVVFDVAGAAQRAVHGGQDSWIRFTSDLLAVSDDELVLFNAGLGRWERRRIADWSVVASGEIGIGNRHVAAPPSADGGFLTATMGVPTIPVWTTDRPSDPNLSSLTAQAPISQAGPIALSPDGTHLAVMGAGSVFVAHVAPANAVAPADPAHEADTAENAPVREPTLELPAAGAVARGNIRFLGDSRHLLTATGDQIALWSLDQVDRIAKVMATGFESSPCNACAGSEVAVSPDGNRLALLSSGGPAAAILALPGQAGEPQSLPGVTAIPLWRKDGELVLVIAQPVQDGSEVGPGAVRFLHVGGVERIDAAALTPDENTVVAVDSAGGIYLEDLESGAVRDVIPGSTLQSAEGEFVEDVAINPTADLVASVVSGSVSIIDIRGRREIGSIAGDDATRVRFAGSRLLVQRKAGNLEVWDDRGKAMTRVIGSGGEGYFAAPVSDIRAKFVARMTVGYSIDIFDIGTGALIYTIPPLPGSIRTNYAFAPNSLTLVTTSDFYTEGVRIVVRDLSPPSLIASACDAAGSNLSPDEWLSLAGSAEAGEPACRHER